MQVFWDSLANGAKKVKDSYAAQYVINQTRSVAYNTIYAKEAKAGVNMNQITPELWLGDMIMAHNKEEMKKHGITHIVCAAYAHSPPFPEDFKYLNLPVVDSENENIIQFFDKSAAWIHDAIINGGCVFVHCAAGVSRSTTIVSAYLMRVRDMKAQQALEYIKARRQKAQPNQAFLRQLIEYESLLSQSPEVPDNEPQTSPMFSMHFGDGKGF